MSDFNDILKEIDRSISQFNKRIPAAQKEMYQELVTELRRLDLNGDKIKTTVANLKTIQSIKNKLTKIILSDDYLSDVKDFAKAFTTVSDLQNEYWKGVEAKFKPTALLKEIRLQAIGDTVQQLTESGIGANIGDRITDILRTNITSGGSYKALNAQLLESLTDTEKSDGLLTKYSKQVTTDSINQYSAQYTQAAASGLNFEWYSYQGSEIKTSREFCQAMVENRRYFHISEVPALLKAEGLEYVDNYDGKTKKVRINPRTNLPYGFIDGTNPENFFIRRAGYQCGHQIRPVPERNVPLEVRNKVYSTLAYQQWVLQNEGDKKNLPELYKGGDTELTLYRGDTRDKGEEFRDDLTDYIFDGDVKNKAAFNFFTDDKSLANKYAISVMNAKGRTDYKNPVITTIKTAPLNLLDFNRVKTFGDLNRIFFNGEMTPEQYSRLVTGTTKPDKYLLETAFKNMETESIPHASHFSNGNLGVWFKELLLNKEYDGYVFFELADNFAIISNKKFKTTNREKL